MTGLIIYISISVLLLVATVALLLRSHKPTKRDNCTFTIDDFLPVHHREFEEVERRLAQYEAMLLEVQTQRRSTALEYLEALETDFLRVQVLLNHAARFLPDLTVRGEWDRFSMRIKFWSECRLTLLQVYLGIIPAERLKQMTRKVRTLAERADQALNVIAREHGIRALQSDLNT